MPMKLEDVDFRAVRAFDRIIGPKFHSLFLAEEADAGFDGGEFSGPAHGEDVDSVINEVAQTVATCFGYTRGEVLEMVDIADHHAREKEFEAHTTEC